MRSRRIATPLSIRFRTYRPATALGSSRLGGPAGSVAWGVAAAGAGVVASAVWDAGAAGVDSTMGLLLSEHSLKSSNHLRRADASLQDRPRETPAFTRRIVAP